MIERTDIKPNASQPHTLPSRTSQRTIQSLSKSVSEPTHGRKESTGIQQRITKMANYVLKREFCVFLET